jgi:hypothetical protein
MRRVLILCLLAGFAAPVAAGDDEPPRITVPAGTIVEAQSFAGAVVTYAVTADDGRGRPIDPVCDPSSGSMFPIGPTSVTCTATAHGQATTRRFTANVVDRTPPTLTVPQPKTLRTTYQRGATVTFDVAATDVVDGPVAPACSKTSGARFLIGVTKVMCTANDRRGNAGSASFNVTVTLVRMATAKRSSLFAPLAGTRVSAPPMLRWRAVPKAKFYNAQVYRSGRKILSLWPSRSRLKMTRSWRHEGRTFRLKPGVYTWYVWPGFGTLARPRFGKLLGQSSFRVV